MFADVVKFELKSRRFGKSDEARRCLTKLGEAGWTVTKLGDVQVAFQRSGVVPMFGRSLAEVRRCFDVRMTKISGK
jgi:hypothetical protein